MNLHGFLHPYVVAFTPAAAAALASASVVLLAAWMIARSMRDAHAETRYRLLLGALAAFAVPLPLLFAVVVANRDRLRALFPSESQVAAHATTFELALSDAPAAAPVVDWQCPTIFFVMAVALILLARTALRASMTHRALVAAAAPAPEAATVIAEEVRTSLGVTQPVPLFVADGVSSPVAVGLRRPFVLLPALAVSQLSETGLRAVLLHELAHVARRDNMASLIDSAVACVFWFNPFVWLVRRELQLERERACDHSAVSEFSERADFVDALLTLCRGTLRDARPGVSCINSSNINERVDYIMRSHQITASRRTGAMAWALTFATALFAVVVAGTFVDKPLFAGEQGSRYVVRTKTRSLDAKRIHVTVDVLDAKSRALVASPTIVVARGETAQASTAYIEAGVQMKFETEITFSDETNGKVKLRALENGVAVYEQESAIVAAATKATSELSLSLLNADVHDVMRTFAQLTGRTIFVSPAVQGKVSIDAQNMPWFEAFAKVVSQVHASVRTEDDGTIHVEPATEWKVRTSRPELASAPQSKTFERQPSSVVPHSDAVPLTDDITKPGLVERVDPMYTTEAMEARVAGMCVIAVEIDESGNVAATRVLKPMPFGLSEAAETAVKQWKFTPATKDGQPIRVKMNLTINFRPE